MLADAAGVGEQLLDGHHGLLGRVVREVARDGRVEVDLALFDELQDERGGELLGHRPDAVLGVGRVGDAPRHLGFAEAVFVHHLVARGEQDRAVEQADVVIGLHQRVDVGGDVLSRGG